MGRATILSKISTFILTGGRRTTASGTRDVLTEMADSYVSAIYDTAANFTANNPILETKQHGVETDGLTTAPKFKIGDGVTAWNSLPYSNCTSQTLADTLVNGHSTGNIPIQSPYGKSVLEVVDSYAQLRSGFNRYFHSDAFSNIIRHTSLIELIAPSITKNGVEVISASSALTTNTIPKATGTDTIGDSNITDNGTTVNISVSNSQIVASGVSSYIIFDNGINTGYLQNRAASTAIAHSDLIEINAPLINVPQLTPSQIVETDASKNLVSAAKGTAYNKNFGTTAGTVLEGSAITQTITNGDTTHAPSGDVVFDMFKNHRQIYSSIRITQDSATITGTTSETLLASTLVPANTFSVDDVINLEIRCKRASATSTTSHRIRVNTSNSLSGATSIALVQNHNAILMPTFSRNLVIKSSTNTEVMGTSATFSTDVGSITSAISSINIDWTIDQYIIISVQPSASAETNILSYLLIERR